MSDLSPYPEPCRVLAGPSARRSLLCVLTFPCFQWLPRSTRPCRQAWKAAACRGRGPAVPSPGPAGPAASAPTRPFAGPSILYAHHEVALLGPETPVRPRKTGRSLQPCLPGQEPLCPGSPLVMATCSLPARPRPRSCPSPVASFQTPPSPALRCPLFPASLLEASVQALPPAPSQSSMTALADPLWAGSPVGQGPHPCPQDCGLGEWPASQVVLLGGGGVLPRGAWVGPGGRFPGLRASLFPAVLASQL